MNKLNLNIEHLKKSFSYPVLRDINLHMTNSDYISIVGSSGAGKSTLMNIIGLIETYDEGKYEFNGTVIRSNKDYAKLRIENIGFIFQNYNLISQLSCKDNILLPAVYKRKKIEDKELERLAELLNITKLLDQRVNVLSGGEKQRVAIARSLILDPCLLIADEPTGNLDEKNRKIICNLLDEENKKGRGIILITHDDEMAVSAKTMLRLEKGVLV
ncbi:MAG: ABC transporter ATP-binding protein [Agathobacter sp.]|nr:ABC transporter ATP-binding protein [Agathobacter sp.]